MNLKDRPHYDDGAAVAVPSPLLLPFYGVWDLLLFRWSGGQGLFPGVAFLPQIHSIELQVAKDVLKYFFLNSFEIRRARAEQPDICVNISSTITEHVMQKHSTIRPSIKTL